MAKAILKHNALFAVLWTRAKYRAGFVWAELADLANAEDPHEGHWECVRAALRAEGATDCLRDDEIATRTRDRLARRLIETLKDLQQFVDMDGEPPADENAAKETAEGPILKWDALLADWFETRFKAHKAAIYIRQKARDRWEVFERQLTIDGVANAGKLWDGWYFSPKDTAEDGNHLPEEQRAATDIASLICRVLWRSEFKDFFEKAKRRSPALTSELYGQIGLAFGKRRGVVLIPQKAAGALTKLAKLDAMGTLVGHQAVRFLINAGTAADNLHGHGPIVIAEDISVERITSGAQLIVTGGVRRLSEYFGCNRQILKDVLNILGTHALKWEGKKQWGSGSIITVDESGGYRGKKRRLAVYISPLLLPGPIHTAHQRVLFPVIVELPRMPNAPRVKPHLALLDWLAVGALGERRREIAQYGAATLDWSALAKEAGVSSDMLARALELWTSDQARWEQKGNRWILAEGPDTAEARRFLLQGAKLAAERSAAGIASGKARRQRLKRGGSKKRKSEKKGSTPALKGDIKTPER